MATIKLGDLTLGKVALGSSTIGDTRKISRNNIFKAEAIKNHPIDKEIINAIRAYELVRDSIPGANGNPSIGIGTGGGDSWLLANGIWDDNGVWDDTQIWND